MQPGRGLVTISVRACLVADAVGRPCKLGEGALKEVQPRQASNIYLGRSCRQSVAWLAQVSVGAACRPCQLDMLMDAAPPAYLV